jgi:hypothetical protein
MDKMTFEERDEEVREGMEEDGMSGPFDVFGESVYCMPLSEAIDLDGGNRYGGRIVLPNERLALLWRKVFRVQFTDGGWKDAERGRQMEHPFEYASAKIEVDTSRRTPRFKSYETHEEMAPPTEHFDVVPNMYNDMVYLIRLFTGDDSYAMDELKEDLRLLEQMKFDVASIDNCSRCNPNIY